MADATENQRVVIRDNDLYGGDLEIEMPSRGGYPREHLTLNWGAYAGGGARIEIQDAREMEAVGKLLLEAAEMVDPGRIERD